MRLKYLLAALLIACALPARADDSSYSAAHPIIARHLEAIHSRDADTAFSLTTPDFHGRFTDAQKFLKRVRFEYRPLYNYDSFRLVESHSPGDRILTQTIEVKDRYGNSPVIVLYRLEQQEDGAWLIDSFAVLNSAEAQPI